MIISGKRISIFFIEVSTWKSRGNSNSQAASNAQLQGIAKLIRNFRERKKRAQRRVERSIFSLTMKCPCTTLFIDKRKRKNYKKLNI